MRTIQNELSYILLIWFICLQFTAAAQVGINILIPDSSAVLQLESTERGFLPPRLDDAQRDLILDPADGLIIYNTSDSVVEYFNGDCWLPVYRENCNDCEFDLTLSDNSDTIDRILIDSVSTQINVTQTNGSPQDISVVIIPTLPPGITATIDNPVINSTGSTGLSVSASIFADPGTYPVLLQAVCGPTSKLLVYVVVVEPCIQVSVTSSTNNYDLQALNGLPGPGSPICVLLDILPGVEINSATTSTPAYSSGNLDPQSHVGIRNSGAILGMGGDGGVGGNFNNFPPGDPGKIGGNGMDLSCRTTLINNGYIFGGGSGGASVGIGFSVPIPIIGTFTFAIGGGGGGGASSGLGGTASIPLPVFVDGTDATGSITGIAGAGGQLNIPISIPITPVTINITPSGTGGDGGEYGRQGQAGNLAIDVSVTVPIVGTINVLNQSVNGPTSDLPGLAIKRNGNTLSGFPDGNYQTNFIKGIVGP